MREKEMRRKDSSFLPCLFGSLRKNGEEMSFFCPGVEEKWKETLHESFFYIFLL